MKTIIPYLLTNIFILSILFSCNIQPEIPSPINNSKEKIKTVNPSLVETDVVLKKVDWSNPAMSPYGKSIVNIIRGYFLVGKFDVVKKFMTNTDCIDNDEFDYILRNSQWGYDINLTNLKWNDDKTFIITFRTSKELTAGMDQYYGKVVNDTAKIFFHSQNKKNPFIYNKKFPSAEVSCEIKKLTKSIRFNYDSSLLTKSAITSINKLAQIIKNYPMMRLIIEGHTSNEGEANYNLKLSLRRSKAVQKLLITNGVLSSNIECKGFGSSYPIYNSNIELESTKNRRVEFLIINN